MKNSSPLLIKYLRAYEQNKKSRVFAPLAETYRKIGKVEEALKILKEGIRFHPTYTLGYLVLAHCYFDKNQYEFAYNTLRPLVADNLDNVGLQKLFAETSEKLLYLEEALETYKYLLFLNPKDQVVSERVKTLEAAILKEKSSYLISDEAKTESSLVLSSSDDNWVQLDLSKGTKNEERNVISPAPFESKNVETKDWSIQKVESNPVMDQDFYDVEKASLAYDEDEEMELSPEEESLNDELMEGLKDQAPVMTLTLVDIYCSQKLFTKAEEVLEKILELTPHDQRILDKLKEVQLLSKSKITQASESRDLMQAYDQAMELKKSRLVIIEKKYHAFLTKIKEQARNQLS
jgi:tetratricopeptide (TPR) repeat protein